MNGRFFQAGRWSERVGPRILKVQWSVSVRDGGQRLHLAGSLVNVCLMPITLDQIVQETRHWPPEKVGELVGRLTEDLHASAPEIEAAWKAEITRRVDEIQTGKVQGIPGEEVSAGIRRILGR